MADIVPPSSQSTLIEGGMASNEFYRWIVAITDLDIMTGSGSPEGVVEATVARIYMDTAGTAGNILYIKRDADIAGDRTQGWILI